MSHSVHNEWVFYSRCTHHMAKDATLFTKLNKTKDSKIYIVDDFALDVASQGDVAC
jgi:hypothetical protein